MRLKTPIAALAALACLALAPAAWARPYLMLLADDRGFWALDLDTRRNGDVAQATLIEAPLAGAPYDGKVAPLVKHRIEVACQIARWRQASSEYTDAHEALLARDDNGEPWADFDPGDRVKTLVQTAACLKLYSQNLVSRKLNIGEILAGYQAAHAQAKAEPPTEKQLLAERYKAAH